MTDTMSMAWFIECLKKGEVPPLPLNSFERLKLGPLTGNYIDYRNEASSRGMWALVNKIWTKQLADWIDERSCLEVMSGAGWLAKALDEHGVNITATDDNSWTKGTAHVNMKFVHPVEQLHGIEAVRKYSDREVLIISWPPYTEDEICNICKEWGSKKPIIYIGEGEGGCNAVDEFFNHFKEDDGPPNFPMQRWDGMHDYVCVGYYK